MGNNKDEKIQFWSLNTASFMGQLTISMVNLALVYYLRYTLSASATAVGFAASTYTLVYLVCCLAFGHIYQRFRPVCVVCTSVLGMAVSVALITLCTSVASVFVFLVLYGFFMSMLWPQVESWITRGAEGARLNKLTGAFNFSWSFGTGISPYLTSLLVVVSPSFALSAAALLFVLMAVLIIASVKAAKGMNVCAEKEHMTTVKVQEGGEDHSTPLRFDSWIAVFVVYSALSVVLNIFPMYAGEVAGMSSAVSGFLLLLRGLATCAAFMSLGRMRFWQFKAWMIYLCEALFIILALSFHNVSGTAGTAVFFILFGLIFAQCYSFSIFHSAAGALNRGRRMVIHECVLTAGQIIGASFGGSVYQRLGYSNVLLFLAAVAAVMLVCQLAVHCIVRKKKA